MQLTVEELLGSIRWTLNQRVAPTIEDSLARRYLQSIDALLGHIERRLRHEPAALIEEIADLRQLLGQAPEEPRATEDLGEQAIRLREQLVKAMPDLRNTLPNALNGYLRRQLAREATFMPTSAEGLAP